MESKIEEQQRKRNGIEKNRVAQILARVKVGETGYSLIQDVEHACEWYRDSLIVNVQD